MSRQGESDARKLIGENLEKMTLSFEGWKMCFRLNILVG